MMRKLLLATVACLVISEAFAGQTQIQVRDANGTIKVYDVVTDALGNFVGMFAVCDGTAAANCASIKAASTAAAQTDPAVVVRNPDAGTISDTAYTGTGTGTENALLKAIYNAVVGSIPSGNNNIGVVTPYAAPGSMVRGAASTTGTASTTLIAAQGSLKIYVTGLQCYRSDTGSTPVTVTFNDVDTTGSGTTIVLPGTGGGSGSNVPLLTPLVTAASGAFTFTAGAAISTIFCNAQGYSGN